MVREFKKVCTTTEFECYLYVSLCSLISSFNEVNDPQIHCLLGSLPTKIAYTGSKCRNKGIPCNSKNVTQVKALDFKVTSLLSFGSTMFENPQQKSQLHFHLANIFQIFEFSRQKINILKSSFGGKIQTFQKIIKWDNFSIKNTFEFSRQNSKFKINFGAKIQIFDNRKKRLNETFWGNFKHCVLNSWIEMRLTCRLLKSPTQVTLI